MKVARETCDLYLANFQKCDRERVLTEGRATKAEEVEDARNKGYDEGWDVAGVEYEKQVREIEAELHMECFLD
ncbi:hypothetical protein RHMOL_Rhmol02G0201700 [Rhododendron molle]|uniref:Uncharacterized protein n=1 Tax=Rhododendron molle TaxID=49168 RepID=A0ACC0PTS7_RHOML|nr:hypothetical protein RHMOL_Rhmol02G0201700 [Rhododendron molle]